MSYQPDRKAAPDFPAPSLVKSTARKAAKAYSENPSGVGLQALLSVIVVMLVFRVPVHGMLYVLLLVLAGIRFHEWFRKEGQTSPLFSSIFMKLYRRQPKKK